MKKVLFVTESLARGGMERVLVDLSNALASRGYSVSIVTYESTDCLKSELLSSIEYHYVKRRVFSWLKKIPVVRWLFRKLLRKNGWETNASARSLYKYYVGNGKYDVEIAFYRGPSIKIISGSPNRKSRKIAWVHTDFKLCDPKSYLLFFRNLEEVREAYGTFDVISCVSKAALESFSEVIGWREKCTVVYNMVPLTKIREKGNAQPLAIKRKFTIATLGRLIPDKGVDRLLKAIARLNKDGFDFDVWIIGGGRAYDELNALARDFHLQNVVFWGMQENPYPLLKQSNLFVCSSIREGFNIALVEAMAFGLPVLSTRCTGPTEILDEGKYGLLVDNSENGLYDGIKRVLVNPDLLEAFHQKSLERCLRFCEDRIISQVIDLMGNTIVTNNE